MLRRPIQNHDRRGRTRLFGLFAALWVGLAMQPCAVASVAEQDCPHCPSQAEQGPAMHESHCDPAARVIPDISPDCDTVQADCCQIVDGTVNVVRDGDFDPDKQPTGLVASEPRSHPDPGRFENPGFETGPPEPSGESVPLHVLKCVYLN